MTSRLVLSLLLAGSVVMASCGGRRGDIVSGEKIFVHSGEVEVDAFLFDAKLWRDGKPTSFRLEIYQADTIAGLSGRGYLGKGALKGRMTADSMVVYFPSTNEYIRESIAGVLGSIDCAGEEYPPSIVRLTRSLPEKWVLDSDYVIDSLSFEDNSREYSIAQENCLWELRVSYTLADSTWYLDDLEFDSGDSIRLTARRRTLKTGTMVEVVRFAAPISPGAVRIIP